MKASLVAALLAGALAAGCVGDEPANPNLAAPKLVVQARPDGGASVFVHGAFGDRLYEWVSVAIDNVTLENRTSAFSVEEQVNATGFYIDAAAGTAQETYSLHARIDVDPVEERVIVSLVNEKEEWDDPQSFGLPFERVLTRRPNA